MPRIMIHHRSHHKLFDLIKSSKSIINSRLAVSATFDEIDINNRSGVYWLASSMFIAGNDDPRARRGKFHQPWSDVTPHQLCAMPTLQYISDTLSDLLDQRAVEINNLAKKENKKIIVLWSGGIDSTSVLVSFLKNLSRQDLGNVYVGMNQLSIDESPKFYEDQILNKLKTIEIDDIKIDDDFLKNHILLHGDPGDSLFGPSMRNYLGLIKRGQHLDNFTDHLGSMAEGINGDTQLAIKGPGIDSTVVEKFYKCYGLEDNKFGSWYINKLHENIVDCGVQDHITTVADFWWWNYFNIKWNYYVQIPLFTMRRNFEKALSTEETNKFVKYTFFNTDKFQQWSWSNLKRLIQKDVHKTHKLEARSYIFDFDKDEHYFETKRKFPSSSIASMPEYKRFYLFDENYVGHEQSDKGIRFDRILSTVLEKFKE